MFNIIKNFFTLSLIFFAGSFLLLSPARASTINVIQLDDDAINPVTAEYITKNIERAEKENAECIIIKMDTPGGLLSSTRIIIKKILQSTIPVIVYVSPDGSRAGSAGVFITYASHVAAMTPLSNIGAAHPVNLSGEKPSKESDDNDFQKLLEEIKTIREEKSLPKETPKDITKENSKSKKEEVKKPIEKVPGEELEHDSHPMESKVLQDTVAFIRTLAIERGRNEEWAIKSVVKSSSITAKEAFDNKIIEIIAKDDSELIEKLDERTVKLHDKEIVLHTKNAVLNYIPLDSRQKFFNFLSDPNIAYFLLIIGFYAILFEITHPGVVLPGIIGGVFVILSLYTMQTLPTNWAGFALIIFGLILFVAEIFTPGFGILFLGGLVSFVLGSLLLFDTVDPIMRVGTSSIGALVLFSVIFILFLSSVVLRAARKKPKGGQEGMLGDKGYVFETISPDKSGKVFVHGEIWNAISESKLHKGEKIIVTGIDGLTVKVEKRSES